MLFLIFFSVTRFINRFQTEVEIINAYSLYSVYNIQLDYQYVQSEKICFYKLAKAYLKKIA